MHYGPLDYLLLIAYVGLRVALCLILWRRGMAKSWPALFTLAAVEGLCAILLLVVKSNYHTYYYTYWTASALGGFLSVGVLRDVLCAIPGTPFVPKHISAFLGTFAVIVTTVFVGIHFEDISGNPTIVQVVLALNDGVQSTWYLLSLAFLASMAVIGFGWPSLPLKVTCGCVVEGLVSTLSSHLASRFPIHTTSIFQVWYVAYLAVLFFWCLCFAHQNPRDNGSYE